MKEAFVYLILNRKVFIYFKFLILFLLKDTHALCVMHVSDVAAKHSNESANELREMQNQGHEDCL